MTTSAPTKAAPTKTAPVKARPAKSASAQPVVPAETEPAATTPPKPSRRTTPARSTGSASTIAAATAPAPEGWSDVELAEIRTLLETEAVALQAELDEAERMFDATRSAGLDATGDDQADAGTATFEREHEMSLANNSRDLLLQTERALHRIDVGTYGICENCADPIAKARLQAFPRATLCVTCKAREERR